MAFQYHHEVALSALAVFRHLGRTRNAKACHNRYLGGLARFLLETTALPVAVGSDREKQKESKNKPQEKEKGEAAMPSSLRRATVIMILLGVLFVPGLLQARTPARDGMRVSRPAAESGFFSMVWSLLTNFREIGAGIAPTGSSFAKNGGMLDPNGGATPPPPPGDTSTSTSDNGGMLDPNG